MDAEAVGGLGQYEHILRADLVPEATGTAMYRDEDLPFDNPKACAAAVSYICSTT